MERTDGRRGAEPVGEGRRRAANGAIGSLSFRACARLFILALRSFSVFFFSSFPLWLSPSPWIGAPSFLFLFFYSCADSSEQCPFRTKIDDFLKRGLFIDFFKTGKEGA